MDPIQPPTQEPMQSPTEINVPQPKPNWILIILSILSAILLVTVFSLSLQNQKLQKQILNPPVSPTIQIPSPTPRTVSSTSIPLDETANWKIYNFSQTILFKLPQGTKYPLYVNTGRYAQETILPNNTIFQIWGADGASPSGGKDNYEEIKKNITGNQIFQTKAIRINNNEAIEFTSSTVSSEMIWGGEVYQRIRGILTKMSDGRGLIIIHYTNQAIQINEDFEKDDLIFDQILSTFKFIGKTSDSNNFCGGIAGIICPNGYKCKLDGNYPDASGTCIEQIN